MEWRCMSINAGSGNFSLLGAMFGVVGKETVDKSKTSIIETFGGGDAHFQEQKSTMQLDWRRGTSDHDTVYLTCSWQFRDGLGSLPRAKKTQGACWLSSTGARTPTAQLRPLEGCNVPPPGLAWPAIVHPSLA
jgi:hypothetical protein